MKNLGDNQATCKGRKGSKICFTCNRLVTTMTEKSLLWPPAIGESCSLYVAKKE
jgi:hypothetical protein